MTVKEAMSAVREACTTYAENYCDFQSGEYKQFDVACEMAIEALQKQEPEAPVLEDKEYYDECCDGEIYPRTYKLAKCPSCGEILSQYSNGWSKRPRYCSDCGQRIARGEQEEESR